MQQNRTPLNANCAPHEWMITRLQLGRCGQARATKCSGRGTTKREHYKNARLSFLPDLRAIGRRLSRYNAGRATIRRHISLPDAGNDHDTAMAGTASGLDGQARTLFDWQST